MSPSESITPEGVGPPGQSTSTRGHQEAYRNTVAAFLEQAHCRPVRATVWQMVAPGKQAAF